MGNSFKHDVLVIGSGAAGLGASLCLAEAGLKIAIITKDERLGGSSLEAQGGIAAVMKTTDSFNAHIQDTLVAGDGLCDPKTVAFTVKHAKEAIDWLTSHGVQFSLNATNSDYHLNQEGGHSHRRILHVADQTGSAVVLPLATQVQQHPNIDCYPHHMAIELVIHENRCVGAEVLIKETGKITTFYSKHTVLASGGASKVYLLTTHFGDTTGDGIAMAKRSNCHITHMEFNQFHPTCLYAPSKSPFLISESLRGEGGKLILPDGTQFMPFYDQRAELAPRDIVSRSIYQEMQRNHLDCVFLDARHIPKKTILQYFPKVYQGCLQRGINLMETPIPVVPAAHYTCGGVSTNLKGETNRKGLYAIGETAYTGLHGANRLANNSLLECLVFAKTTAENILATHSLSLEWPQVPHNVSPIIHKNTIAKENFDKTITTLTTTLRELMWRHVGIVRSNHSLHIAQKHFETVKTELNNLMKTSQIQQSLLELRNLVTIAELIIEAAVIRKENRGTHYNVDYAPNSKLGRNTQLTIQR